MTKEKALAIIQKYVGNIGNKPEVRAVQEECARRITTTDLTDTSHIAMTVFFYLPNPHKRQDLIDAYHKIVNDIYEEANCERATAKKSG